jgi:glucose/arabinose dehydrogenase
MSGEVMRRTLGLIVFLLAAIAANADEITLTPVVTGLNQPTTIANAGDLRLFITLQPGRIVVLQGGAKSIDATPFLDISSLVTCCDERGLLGLAFHPRYHENGFFYVDYTNTSGNTVIARYSVSANDPARADPASAKILLTIAQPFANHKGGELQFGPDGYLYIGMGDGGSGGDPGNRAQNLTELLGKILRIDVDNGSPYGIPPSNPFVHTNAARGEIWAYGLRNPWRFSFDRATGDLWIADVGQDLWEEVDFQPATSIGGENYGWRRMEGTHCFNPPTNCRDSTMTLPVVEYDHGGGRCSIIGGYRYRGTRSPKLQGTYLYADWCSGTIWGLNGPAASPRVIAQANLGITTFGEDVNGELFLAENKNGGLFAISEPDPGAGRRRAVKH